MAAHKHKIQYACGYYRQTSGETPLKGNYFFFPLFVPELRDDKATVTSEAKLDKCSASIIKPFRFKATQYNCFQECWAEEMKFLPAPLFFY